jgi:cell division protease FtsH
MQSDLTQSVERIVLGIERKNRVLAPKEREVVVNDELGNALSALALPGAASFTRLSVAR